MQTFYKKACDIYNHIYNRSMKFEWDENKNDANKAKHNVSFELASKVFEYKKRKTVQDKRKNYGEERFITTGLADGLKLCVIFTMRGEYYRLISAWRTSQDD